MTPIPRIASRLFGTTTRTRIVLAASALAGAALSLPAFAETRVDGVHLDRNPDGSATLFIDGFDFIGTLKVAPFVEFGGILIPVKSPFSNNHLEATVSNIGDGEYQIYVERRNEATSIPHKQKNPSGSFANYSLTVATPEPGPEGPQGPTGPQGAQGLQGVRGDPGPVGATGAVGPVGPMGVPGPQGFKGDTGATGMTGMVGPVGPAGPVGPTGPSGPIAGYEIVQGFTNFNGDLSKQISARCPPGKRAVGGSASIGMGGASPDMHYPALMTSQLDDLTGTGWSAEARATSPLTPIWSLYVAAICVNAQ